MYHNNQTFKYQLDKSSKKHICPRCGKRTFVLYLDEFNNAISEEVGRCDRKDNCNWHYTPKQYFQDNSLIMAAETKKIYTMKKETPKPTAPSYIDASLFKSSMHGYERNSLLIFLHSVFDRLVGFENVNRIAMEYAVGTSRQFGGSPIFWQIDEYGRIRSGKIMGYNADTGKRIKKPRPQLQWVHSLMKDKYPDFKLQQCYFGSHRILQALRYSEDMNEARKSFNLSPLIEPTIWLFESEKAALIVSMALAWGGVESLYIPMSCGGCEGFNPSDEKMKDPYDGIQILNNRKVVIFPDEGKFAEWSNKAAGLKGFSKEVYVSTVMERNLHPHKIECDIGAGDAIDDVILRYFSKGRDVAQLLLTSYGYNGEYKII